MITKAYSLICPSCGANTDISISECSYCHTKLRFFANDTVVLPANLNAEDIEKNIVLKEIEFWEETLKAKKAPYSIYKNDNVFTSNDFYNVIYIGRPGITKEIDTLLNDYFVIRGENYVGEMITPTTKTILTSLRLLMFRKGAGIVCIPIENFISLKTEKGDLQENVYWTSPSIGGQYPSRPVLRYFEGGKEQEIPLDPAESFMDDMLMQSVKNCREWELLNPLQKNLLTITRYQIEKAYNIDIKPMERYKKQYSELEKTDNDINATPSEAFGEFLAGCSLRFFLLLVLFGIFCILIASVIGDDTFWWSETGNMISIIAILVMFVVAYRWSRNKFNKKYKKKKWYI